MQLIVFYGFQYEETGCKINSVIKNSNKSYIYSMYMLPHNSYSVLDENNLEDATGWFGTQIQHGINKF